MISIHKALSEQATDRRGVLKNNTFTEGCSAHFLDALRQG
jgi:hypothetical protein